MLECHMHSRDRRTRPGKSGVGKRSKNAAGLGFHPRIPELDVVGSRYAYPAFAIFAISDSILLVEHGGSLCYGLRCWSAFVVKGPFDVTILIHHDAIAIKQHSRGSLDFLIVLHQELATQAISAMLPREPASLDVCADQLLGGLIVGKLQAQPILAFFSLCPGSLVESVTCPLAWRAELRGGHGVTQGRFATAPTHHLGWFLFQKWLRLRLRLKGTSSRTAPWSATPTLLVQSHFTTPTLLGRRLQSHFSTRCC